MSASTDIAQANKVFDPNHHIRALCVNTSVCIPEYLEVQYCEGWKNLIEDFIKAIRRCHIQLMAVESLYGILEIRFRVTKRTHEVRVWRAIEEARFLAQHTCASCGNNTFLEPNLIEKYRLCRDCLKQGGAKGQTGTWLDKF